MALRLALHLHKALLIGAELRLANLTQRGGRLLQFAAQIVRQCRSPPVRDLIADLDSADLHRCVIALDAMHTQNDPAKAILDALPRRTCYPNRQSPPDTDPARLA